jgi:hypothetical protein
VDWMHLAQDKDQFRSHIRWGIFLLAKWLLASQEGLCSIQLVLLMCLTRAAYFSRICPHTRFLHTEKNPNKSCRL